MSNDINKDTSYDERLYTSLNLYEILVNWFSNAPTRPLILRMVVWTGIFWIRTLSHGFIFGELLVNYGCFGLYSFGLGHIAWVCVSVRLVQIVVIHGQTNDECC